MENKKIVDYKVICESSHYFENGGSNLIYKEKEFIDAKNELLEIENYLILNNLYLEVVNKLLLLEVDKPYPSFDAKETFRLYYLLNLDIFREPKEFKISEYLRGRLLSKKESYENAINDYEEKIEELKLKIEELELKLKVINEISSQTNALDNINPVVRQMQHYANLGYVLQGGYYKRDRYGYQAMVKYEE